MKNLTVKRGLLSSAPRHFSRLDRRQAERGEMRQLKRVSIGLLALTVAFTVASAAYAGGNGAQTSTTLEKNVTQGPSPAINPCTGVPGTLTVTFNLVIHMTTSDNHSGFNGTVTGSALFVPDDPSQPTYTGHFTNVLNAHPNEDNLQNATAHFTSDIEAVGSDGSHLKFHGSGHTTINANGEITTQFDNFFCG